MHQNSLRLMSDLLGKHAPPGGRVLDVGSYNVNGTYRDFFGSSWAYVGADASFGPNVDMVLPLNGPWPETEPFQLVISGQTLEHVERPWLMVKQMAEKMAPGATMILIAPFAWPFHEYPIDTFRFSHQGLSVMMQDAGLTYVEGGLSAINASCTDAWAVGRSAG